jgi:hypothetical protein
METGMPGGKSAIRNLHSKGLFVASIWSLSEQDRQALPRPLRREEQASITWCSKRGFW